MPEKKRTCLTDKEKLRIIENSRQPGFVIKISWKIKPLNCGLPLISRQFCPDEKIHYWGVPVYFLWNTFIVSSSLPTQNSCFETQESKLAGSRNCGVHWEDPKAVNMWNQIMTALWFWKKGLPKEAPTTLPGHTQEIHSFSSAKGIYGSAETSLLVSKKP